MAATAVSIETIIETTHLAALTCSVSRFTCGRMWYLRLICIVGGRHHRSCSAISPAIGIVIVHLGAARGESSGMAPRRQRGATRHTGLGDVCVCEHSCMYVNTAVWRRTGRPRAARFPTCARPGPPPAPAASLGSSLQLQS